MHTAKLFSIKNSVKFIATIGLMGVFSMSHSDDADRWNSERTPQQFTLEVATKAAVSALRQCRRDGYAVSVAVVDRGGNLLIQVRNPDAGPHTLGSSQGKAFTSASMGQPTTRLANAIAENPALNGLRDMDSRLVILAGGLPIVFNGELVGGIGVGGAPGGHLDEACALHGLQQISDE